jgi:hypothetical protein
VRFAKDGLGAVETVYLRGYSGVKILGRWYAVDIRMLVWEQSALREQRARITCVLREAEEWALLDELLASVRESCQ